MASSVLPPAAAPADGLVAPGTHVSGVRPFVELVTHLVRRNIDSSHRLTLLGWAWPLARQLAQLAALVFIFGSVLDLGIEHFPVFVFSGLVAWSWFSGGVTAATSSLLDQRHLIFQPRFPRLVLPIVAVSVPLVDVLLALPVLIVLAAFELGIEWTIVLLPLLVALQLALMSGLAWLLAAASVFSRDVPNLVAVALQILFYMTPVFYSLRAVPDQYASILSLNPMTVLVEGWRAALLGDPWPSVGRFAYVLGLSVALCVVGCAVFRRLSRRFVDAL